MDLLHRKEVRVCYVDALRPADATADECAAPAAAGHGFARGILRQRGGLADAERAAAPAESGLVFPAADSVDQLLVSNLRDRDG